jgi:hypothetical protein
VILSVRQAVPSARAPPPPSARDVNQSSNDTHTVEAGGMKVTVSSGDCSGDVYLYFLHSAHANLIIDPHYSMTVRSSPLRVVRNAMRASNESVYKERGASKATKWPRSASP